MKFNRLVLKNYRQYKEFDFKFDEKNPQVFIGVMGTGKTNLLNAVNWCLYNNEPYLSREESDEFPILNLQEIERVRIEDNGEQDLTVRVEIEAETEEKKSIQIIREENYIVYSDKTKNPSKTDNNLMVLLPDDDNNTEIKKQDEAEEIIARFIPEEIKNFFFFDGDKLDRYFKEATADQINNAISKISQTNLLKKMENHLSDIINEYTKEIGKKEPEIESIREEKEEIENSQKQTEDDMEYVNDQISKIKIEIARYRKGLKDSPDSKKLQLENEEKKKDITGFQERLETLSTQRNNIILKSLKLLMIYPALKVFEKNIQKMKKQNKLPPTTDKDLLKKILHDGVCICNREIKEKSPEEEHLESLMQKFRLSSTRAHEIMQMGDNISRQLDNVIILKNKLRKFSLEIQEIEKRIAKKQKRIDEIKIILSNFDVNKISKLQNQLEEGEELLEKNIKKLGVLETENTNKKKDIDDLEKNLQKELNKSKKHKELKKQINFAGKAKNILSAAKKAVVGEIRNDIEEETNRQFKKLMWKDKTFEKILMKEKKFSVQTKMGFDGLSCLSGGEREITALSFIIALQKVSGFEAPLMIDRPLSMVSGESIGKIVDSLIELGKKRQLFLFLTTNDYRLEGVSSNLNKNFINIRKLRLSENEKTVSLVEL